MNESTENQELTRQATSLFASDVWRKRQDIITASAISRAGLYTGRVLILAAALTIVGGVILFICQYNQWDCNHSQYTRLTFLPLVMAWPVSWLFYKIGYKVGTNNAGALWEPQTSSEAIDKALHHVTEHLPNKFINTGLCISLGICATLPVFIHLCVASLFFYYYLDVDTLYELNWYMVICVFITMPAHIIFIGLLNVYVKKSITDNHLYVPTKIFLGIPGKCAVATCLFTLLPSTVEGSLFSDPFTLLISLFISLVGSVLVFITGILVIAMLRPLWRSYQQGLLAVRQWNSDFASCPAAADPTVWQFLHSAPKDFHQDT